MKAHQILVFSWGKKYAVTQIHTTENIIFCPNLIISISEWVVLEIVCLCGGSRGAPALPCGPGAPRPVRLEARSDIPWLPLQARTEAGLPSRCVCCTSWYMHPGEWGTPPSLSGTCPSCCRLCWTSCQTKVSGLRLQVFPRRGGRGCLGASPVGTSSGWGGQCPQLSPSSGPASP